MGSKRPKFAILGSSCTLLQEFYLMEVFQHRLNLIPTFNLLSFIPQYFAPLIFPPSHDHLIRITEASVPIICNTCNKPSLMSVSTLNPATTTPSPRLYNLYTNSAMKKSSNLWMQILGKIRLGIIERFHRGLKKFISLNLLYLFSLPSAGIFS